MSTAIYVTLCALVALETIVMGFVHPVNVHLPFPGRFQRQVTTPTSSTPPPSSEIVYQIPNCNCPATSEYNPVCGSNGVTYQNRQKLECDATCRTNVTFRKLGRCGGRGRRSVHLYK